MAKAKAKVGENAFENAPAIQVVKGAIKAVPAVKYAYGIAGVIAVIGIVALMGVDLRVAALGTPVLLILMVALVVFRSVASAARDRLALPVAVFIWSSLILIVAVGVLLVVSAFFNVPMPLRDVIIPPKSPPPTAPIALASENTAEVDARTKSTIQSAMTQANAGDYPSAWKTLAATLAEQPHSAPLQDAQVNVAMMWLRDVKFLYGKTYSPYVDPLLPCLSERAASATGVEAANVLAHIGWAYQMKQRDGETRLNVEDQFRRALAIDPDNVYAHAMWGSWILSWGRHGTRDEAEKHFAAALQTGKERPFVRHLQINALKAMGDEENGEAAVHLIRALDDMRRNHETLDADTRADLVSSVYFMHWETVLGRLDSILPPADHLTTFRWLIDGSEKQNSAIPAFWLARLTEATGDYAAAMSLYLEASSNPFRFGQEIEKGIQRCTEHGGDLEAVLVSGMSSEKPAQRAAAAAAAGAVGPKAKGTLPKLLDALKDPDANVRGSAATSLPRIGAEVDAFVPSVIAALKDPDRDVRNAAALALRTVGPPACGYIAGLLGEPLARDRLNAARTIHDIAETANSSAEEDRATTASASSSTARPCVAAIPALLKTLHDGDSNVRFAAVDALGEIGGDYRVVGPSLLEVLQRDPDASVRALAAYSLGEFGAAASDAAPAMAEALGETLKDKKDGNGYRGRNIADGIGNIGPNAAPAVPMLITALSTDHLRVPTAAATALGQIGANAKAAIGPLSEALAREGRDYVENEAKPLAQIATALAEAGDVQALPDLKNALKIMRQRPEVAREFTDTVKDAIDTLMIRQSNPTTRGG